MNSAKEKAKELFDKMKGFRILHSHSKKCAKIAVNEILSTLSNFSGDNNARNYWQDVLKEIDNL